MSNHTERFAREITIVKGYTRFATINIAISTLVLLLLVFHRPELLNLLTGGLFLLALTFSSLYQYFAYRFLVNLGTRFDLMPIIKRSLILQAWTNRPIYFFVAGMLSFLAGWTSLLGMSL